MEVAEREMQVRRLVEEVWSGRNYGAAADLHSEHNVNPFGTGPGCDLTLDFEALDLPCDAGERILVYTAEPGSPAQQALDLLASWARTPAAPVAVEGVGEVRP